MKPIEPVEDNTTLGKYWKAVKENVSDFTGWTYLLQYVEQEVSNNFTVTWQAWQGFDQPNTKVLFLFGSHKTIQTRAFKSFLPNIE